MYHKSLSPETIAWEGRAWVPKDDFLALKRELADHMWWERIAASLQEQRDKLHLALAMDIPWPLPDILAKLIEAAEHLLRDHDCDYHGHESYRVAIEYGKISLTNLRAGLNRLQTNLAPAAAERARAAPSHEGTEAATAGAAHGDDVRDARRYR